MLQRQVFSAPARNAEEANRLSAYGAIWDRETGEQLAWVEKGDVTSASPPSTRANCTRSTASPSGFTFKL